MINNNEQETREEEEDRLIDELATIFFESIMWEVDHPKETEENDIKNKKQRFVYVSLPLLQGDLDKIDEYDIISLPDEVVFSSYFIRSFSISLSAEYVMEQGEVEKVSKYWCSFPSSSKFTKR